MNVVFETEDRFCGAACKLRSFLVSAKRWGIRLGVCPKSAEEAVHCYSVRVSGMSQGACKLTDSQAIMFQGKLAIRIVALHKLLQHVPSQGLQICTAPAKSQSVRLMLKLSEQQYMSM